MGKENYYLDLKFSNHILALRKYLKTLLKILYVDDKKKQFFDTLENNNIEDEIQRRVNSFIYVETEIAKVGY